MWARAFGENKKYGMLENHFNSVLSVFALLCRHTPINSARVKSISHGIGLTRMRMIVEKKER
jgi:hypothetical protein